jgi:phosphoenolpyruvate carboxylase
VCEMYRWLFQVTHNVACLARWMAADLYLREIDILRFELSMGYASDEVGRTQFCL